MALEKFWRDFNNGYNIETERYMSRMKEALTSSTSGITSRDQIINPYDFIDFSLYKNNARGQAMYNEHLQTLLNLQAQQQASYQEWYDSEEQQALRMREAGLNPNLNALSPSQSAEAPISEASPLDGIQTNQEIASQAISVFGNLVGSLSSVASLVTSFSNLPLTKAQKLLTNAQLVQTGASTLATVLGNDKLFKSSVYDEISSRLSGAINTARVAQDTFDISAWFANDDNFSGIYESFAPEDSPRYRNLYEQIRKNAQPLLAKAYETNSSVASNKQSWADIISNPYYDDDIVLQLAYMRPLMETRKKVEQAELGYRYAEALYQTQLLNGIDREMAITALNEKYSKESAEYKYYQEYFSGVKGDDVALAEYKSKLIESLSKEMDYKIRSNFNDIYEKDPLSYRGLIAAGFVCSESIPTWKEFALSFGFNKKGNAEHPWLPASAQQVKKVADMSADEYLHYVQQERLAD